MTARAFGGLAAALFALACADAAAATITVVNGDGGNEGLNDPTAKAPVGGNNGTTLGQQRMIALQAAANVWGALLTSTMEIRIVAKFDPIPGCTANSGTVGSAGPTSQLNFGANPPAGAFANTFYPIALAEALSGSNLNGATAEINATFNSDVDGPTCFGTKSFYYGTDVANVPPNTLALFPVVLHELGHGLGFNSFTCVQSGGCGATPFGGFLNQNNVPDIWGRFLAQLPGGTLWADMSNAGRAASMASDPNLVWTGGAVAATAGGLVSGTNGGFIRMHAPGTIQVGSSVSHYSSDVLPDEVMEPVLNLNSVSHDPGRAVPLLRDIGWRTSQGGGSTPLFRNGFE
jgi:hypothetical protein